MCELLLTHEVIVPGALSGNHEESQESVRKKHLNLLIVRGQVTVRVVTSVFVLTTPVITRGGELVRCQGAGTRRETEGMLQRWSETEGDVTEV